MGLLKDLKVVSGSNTKVEQVFEQLFPNFLDINYSRPSEYINYCWNTYVKNRDALLGQNEQLKRNVNGKLFEVILATLLIRERITPIYMSAKVAFVPNIYFDLLLYSKNRGPICLSLKTSFRERYKQADLEAIALKYVHRRAKCYLLTLLEDDAFNVNQKQENGDVIGLDKAIYAEGPVFDKLINDLKSLNLIESPTVNIISTNQIISQDLIDGIIGY